MRSNTSRQCYACAFSCKRTAVPGWHYCPEHLNVVSLAQDYAAQRKEIRKLRRALRDVITEVQDDEDRGLALFRCNAVAVKALKPQRRYK